MAVALDLTTFVTNVGVPVTGLAGANIPEIEIWTTAGAVIQASIDTTEAAGGFYVFTFTPTAGVNYVALFDHDPAVIGQVTPQERFNSISFTEFIDDIVPEGGSEDYGIKLQRLDAAVTTRAAPGNAMDLVANAVDAAAIATDAIDADAIAANAIDAAAIANGAIDAATFAANAIDAAAVAPGAIDAATFAAGAIDSAAIATDAIDADAIAANAIGASELATDAIGADQLATTAVNEIRDSILDDAIRFSGGDIDIAISTRNAVTPLLDTTDQAEHDATQAAIAALVDLDATAVENAVWDATRIAHPTVGTYGEDTGDAPMRGTDGANTTTPMTSALSQIEHDATQTLIVGLNDLSQADVQTALTNQGYTVARAALLDNLDAAISGVAAAVWALTTTGNQLANSFGKALTRLFGEDTRTKLFFASASISTVGREVPTGGISHMEIQVRDDGGSFPGVSYFVVFGYNAGDTATTPPRSSNTAAAAPTDGTFTSTEFPT